MKMALRATLLVLALLLTTTASAADFKVGDRAEVTKRTKLWPVGKGTATGVRPGAVVVIKKLKGKTALGQIEGGKAVGWIKLKYLKPAAAAAGGATAQAACPRGGHRCNGVIVQRCMQGKWVDWDNCAVQKWVCVEEGGTARCKVPGGAASTAPTAGAETQPVPVTPEPAAQAEPDAATQQKARAAKEKGDALRKARKYREAAREYRSALMSWPGYAEAHNGLGQVLYKMKDLPGAAKAYAAAVQHKPDYAKARFNLAFVLRKAGKFERAEASYRQYIAAKPRDPDGYYGLAVSLEKQGKPGPAAQNYRKYAELDTDPKNKKWVDEARATAARLEQQAADPEARARALKAEGDKLRKAKKYSEAAEAYRKAIAASDAMPSAHYNLGYALRKSSRFAEAEAAYRRYTQLKPTDPDGFYGLAASLEKQAKNAEAAKYYREYAKLETRPSEKKWVDKALEKAAALDPPAPPPPAWKGQDSITLTSGVTLKGKVAALRQGKALLATSAAGEQAILGGALSGDGVMAVDLDKIKSLTRSP